MNGKKVLEVIDIYRKLFVDSGIEKIDFPHEKFVDDDVNIIPFEDIESNIVEHCHGMLDQMEKFVAEGRMDKAFRWLGFIQGCLWSMSYYTLEDLKNHNRPDPPPAQ